LRTQTSLRFVESSNYILRRSSGHSSLRSLAQVTVSQFPSPGTIDMGTTNPLRKSKSIEKTVRSGLFPSPEFHRRASERNQDSRYGRNVIPIDSRVIRIEVDLCEIRPAHNLFSALETASSAITSEAATLSILVETAACASMGARERMESKNKVDRQFRFREFILDDNDKVEPAVQNRVVERKACQTYRAEPKYVHSIDQESLHT